MYALLIRACPPAWANFLIALWYTSLIVLTLLTAIYARQAEFPYAEL